MPNNKNVPDATSIRPGINVYVRGNVSFSRITRHVAGDELIKENQRRQIQFRLQPITKPYTQVTLSNARIVPVNPAQMTPEEQYIQNKFYIAEGESNPGHYTIYSKSPYLPNVAQAHPDDPRNVDQVNPTGELAVGLDVTLVLRTYQSNNANNKGVNLDLVICNEPVRYFSTSDLTTRLKEAGIIYNPLPAGTVKNTDLDLTPNQTQPVPAPSEPHSPQPMVNPPVGNPYSNKPEFPMNNPQPAEETWTCPVCNTPGITGNFCNNCGTAKSMANPGHNPYASGGIMQQMDDIVNRS